MDLLAGYGTDDSSSATSLNRDGASNSISKANVIKATGAVSVESSSLVEKSSSESRPSHKFKRGGRRLLSLSTVLPPEILDRLTRPREEDESSVSSSEIGDKQQLKRRKRPQEDNSQKNRTVWRGTGEGHRDDLNLLLKELSSTPMHSITEKSETSQSTNDLVKNARQTNVTNQNGVNLGSAFMNYTNHTDSTKTDNEVVDVHNPTVPSPRLDQVHNVTKSTDDSPKEASEIVPSISFYRKSAAPPVAKFSNLVTQQLTPVDRVHFPPLTDRHQDTNAAPFSSVDSLSSNVNTNDYVLTKSRKQRREEERALRTGQAFRDRTVGGNITTEIHQPSPSEYAPTAHAAAIASRAACYRGLGKIDENDSLDYGEYSQDGKRNRPLSGIAMYDPKSGTDVKGVGVTAKHRSKHQINQLMANAISLEAHRASEAELARLGLGGIGTGKSGGKADSKRKYGW